MAAIGSIQPLWDSISLDKTTSKDNTASSQNGLDVYKRQLPVLTSQWIPWVIRTLRKKLSRIPR